MARVLGREHNVGDEERVISSFHASEPAGSGRKTLRPVRHTKESPHALRERGASELTLGEGRRGLLLEESYECALLAKDGAHGAVERVLCLPDARILAVVARLLIVDAYGRPSALSGLAGLATDDAARGEVDVAKDDRVVGRLDEALGDSVPRRRLLAASSSRGRGDPAHDGGLSVVERVVDKCVEILGV